MILRRFASYRAVAASIARRAMPASRRRRAAAPTIRRMGFILTVITIMLTLDGLWLIQSDRLLRTVRGARWWRLVNAAFVGAQLLILIWIFAARWMNLDPSASSSKALVGAVLIWHLIVLPLAIVLLVIPSAVARALNSLSHVLGGKGRGEGRGAHDMDDRSMLSPTPESKSSDIQTPHATRPSPLPSPRSTGGRESDADG